MFGIGFTEIVVILVIALIAIGPEKLPEIAKAMGRAFGEFKKATDELKKSVADVDVTKDLDVMGDKPDVSGTSDKPPSRPPSPPSSSAKGSEKKQRRGA